jgi:hypothetical protein
VYTANKDKQYRVFKEEVRSLASEVAAKHLAKSSSADQSAVNRVPGAGEGKVARSRPKIDIGVIEAIGQLSLALIISLPLRSEV